MTSFASLREEHKTFLMYGFVAETGLHPSKCELVERHDGNDVIWSFQKRGAVNQYMHALLKERDDEIKMLRERLAHANRELAKIKGP